MTGLDEARAAAAARGTPSTATMRNLAEQLAVEVPDSEVVMSNLGPSLAWYARRPVLHLALSPADVEACRAKVPFRHVLLAFRAADRAWPQWSDLVANPDLAGLRSDWTVKIVRHWESDDGFRIVWIQLGDPKGVAAGSSPAAGTAASAGLTEGAAAGSNPAEGASP